MTVIVGLEAIRVHLAAAPPEQCSTPAWMAVADADFAGQGEIGDGERFDLARVTRILQREQAGRARGFRLYAGVIDGLFVLFTQPGTEDDSTNTGLEVAPAEALYARMSLEYAELRRNGERLVEPYDEGVRRTQAELEESQAFWRAIRTCGWHIESISLAAVATPEDEDYGDE